MSPMLRADEKDYWSVERKTASCLQPFEHSDVAPHELIDRDDEDRRDAAAAGIQRENWDRRVGILT